MLLLLVFVYLVKLNNALLFKATDLGSPFKVVI